jgi:hypothetical protein
VIYSVLFIGGSWDGKRKRLNVADYPTYCVPILQKFSWYVGDVLTPPTFPVHEYERERIRGQHEEFWLYRLSSLTVDEMFRRLLSGYQATEEEPTPSPGGPR